jgi:DNA-binding GntR family transcriptional regulator
MAVEAIRELILRGDLLPGQKLHQAELADRLGVSRVPVREALTTLVSEGLVEHRQNTGYTVTRPSADVLHQIYLMRELLETAVLRSIDLTSVDVDAMERANAGFGAQASSAASDADHRASNREFHFLLFDRSPLSVVVQEVSRLWTLSEFYRSLYMRESGTAARVANEHAEMIGAVRARDIDVLVALSDTHRRGTETSMSPLLARRGAIPANGT